MLLVFKLLLHKKKKKKKKKKKERKKERKKENPRILWNKYLIKKGLPRFNFEQEMVLVQFETLCTVPLYSIPLTIMLRTNAYLILMEMLSTDS